MTMMEIGGVNPGLGVPGPQERELQDLSQSSAEMPTVLDRLRGALSSVVEYVGASIPTPSIPRPSAETTARVVGGALALVGAGGAAALAPVAAEAKGADYSIIPGQGMYGLELGDTTDQVIKVLGGPISGPTDHLDGNIGFNENSLVIELNTTSPRLRTNKGKIHVGSPLSAVPAAYSKAKRGSSPDGPDYSIAGTYRGQEVVTTFYTEHGSKVAEIEVSEKGDQLQPGFGLN